MADALTEVEEDWIERLNTDGLAVARVGARILRSSGLFEIEAGTVDT